MTTQTPYERLKAARLRKKRGLLAVTVPSEKISIDIRKEDLPKLLALAQKGDGSR